MYIQETVNEYDVPASQFKCDTCGDVFTACPAVPAEKRDEWNGCMADTCETYDVARDAEVYFILGLAEREEA